MGMEPSTRKLRALSYAAQHDTKYVTTLHESHYFNTGNTREELIVGNGLENCPPTELDLDFVSDDIKFMFKVDNVFYHFFIDSLPVILKLHREHPDYLILLYLQTALMTPLSHQIIDLLKVVLDGEGVKYKFIDRVPGYDYARIMKINNFAIADPYFSGNNSTSFHDVKYAIDLVVKYSKKVLGLENKVSTPHKKVFITGKSTTTFELVLSDIEGYDGYLDDERMYDREKLEEFFAGKGYEIIDPAKAFDSLFHQVLYFQEVETLAAVTCSGLANMVFMHPGQKVLEIQAELVQNVPVGNGMSGSKPLQGVHTMYSMLSFMKDHLLFSIPSHRAPEPIIKRLESSEIINIL